MSRGLSLMRRVPSAAVAVTVLACAAVVAASTIHLVWRGWLPAPFGDQWQQLVTEHGASSAWLASMHNEHRILVPRLLFIVDRWVSGERNAVDLTANLLIQAAFAGLMVDLLRRGRRPSAVTAALLAAVAVAMAFWAVQWENFTWGFQVQIFGVVLGTAVALHRVAFGGASWPSLLATLAAMACTALTLATGFLAAVVAVPLAWWIGRPRREVVSFSLAAAVFSTLAVASLDRAGSVSGGGVDALRHPLRIAVYAVVALGGPIGDGLSGLVPVDRVTAAFVAGSAGLALLASLLPAALAAPRSPRGAMLSALAIYGVLTAVSTAFGRWSLGPAQAMSSRYATPTLAFWVALCFLLHFAGSRVGLARAWAAAAIPAGLVALALASQGSFAEVAEQVVNLRAEAIPALAAGVADPTAVQDSGMVGPDPLSHLAALRAAHTSLFAEPWLGWSGERLVDDAPTADTSRCAGRILSVEEVAAGARGGSRVRGTLRIAGTASLLRIVLTDEAGTVVGFGIAPPFRDMSASHGVATWVGAAATSPDRALIPYALLRDGSACRLVRPVDASIVSATLSAMPLGDIPRGGTIEDETVGKAVTLEGWAMVGAGSDREGRIFVDTDLPVDHLIVRPAPRPDVADYMQDPRLIASGFLLTIHLKPGDPIPQRPRLCVWTDDGIFGRHLLADIHNPGLCPDP